MKRKVKNGIQTICVTDKNNTNCLINKHQFLYINFRVCFGFYNQFFKNILNIIKNIIKNYLQYYYFISQ